MNKTYKISGMHCTACAINIEDTLKRIDGVKSLSVSYSLKKLTIDHDESKVGFNDLSSALSGLGYTLSDANKDIKGSDEKSSGN